MFCFLKKIRNGKLLYEALQKQKSKMKQKQESDKEKQSLTLKERKRGLPTGGYERCVNLSLILCINTRKMKKYIVYIFCRNGKIHAHRR